ncbi:hypothetical protein ILUMI_00396 [Ignelater luminosus]|uniref:Uncharacterized protein n=1 Tax=Ignelater luminosus TaxID=2038154 RepID=A0A8K0DGC1_IGNLU|nr:hypothetical protein ILUMI_00396 [Ignelater luminosus]
MRQHKSEDGKEEIKDLTQKTTDKKSEWKNNVIRREERYSHLKEGDKMSARTEAMEVLRKYTKQRLPCHCFSAEEESPVMSKLYNFVTVLFRKLEEYHLIHQRFMEDSVIWLKFDKVVIISSKRDRISLSSTGGRPSLEFNKSSTRIKQRKVKKACNCLQNQPSKDKGDDVLPRLQTVRLVGDQQFQAFMQVAGNGKKFRYGAVVEKVQDLFQASEDYGFFHCVSTDLRMSWGIADQFRRRYGRLNELENQCPNVGKTSGCKMEEDHCSIW